MTNKQITFVSILKTTGNVWGQFQTINSGNGRVYYNRIKAWAFPTSNRVNIFCNLHMCAQTCPQYNCPASTRTRRTLPTDDEQLKTITAAFTVQSSLQHSNVLWAKSHSARVVSENATVGVITDNQAQHLMPSVASSSVNADDEHTLCINRIHFGIALALILLIILLLMLFVLILFYRTGCRILRTSKISRNNSPISSDESLPPQCSRP